MVTILNGDGHGKNQLPPESGHPRSTKDNHKRDSRGQSAPPLAKGLPKSPKDDAAHAHNADVNGKSTYTPKTGPQESTKDDGEILTALLLRLDLLLLRRIQSA